MWATKPIKSLSASAHDALASEESFGTTLLVAAAQFMTLEELSTFDFDTVLETLKQEASVDLTGSINASKLEAAMNLMFNPSMFYEDVVGFIDICNVLSGADIDADVFDPADAYEMSWAVTEAQALESVDPDEAIFSEDIRKYMGIVLSQYGFLKPPRMLSMAMMPEGVNPALALADQPDMVAAATGLQNGLVSEVEAMVADQLAELSAQLKPFEQPS